MAKTGYKEYVTDRKYLAKMGDWRFNKDEEVELDGIGGVNILVKAEVHRSGERISFSSGHLLQSLPLGAIMARTATVSVTWMLRDADSFLPIRVLFFM